MNNFFNQIECPNALREKACLIFANTAGKAAPGRANEFGGSSLVLSHVCGFSLPDCAPTFSKGGPRFRDGNNLLSSYKDIYFRERGACIHSFVQINPGSLPPGAAGRPILAVENAYVCPISGTPEPRAPANDVPACVKWLNDELDDVPSLSFDFPRAPLVAEIDTTHHKNIVALRTLSPSSIDRTMELANQHKLPKYADDWGSNETEALKHVTNTLDIFGIGFPPSTFGTDGAHATIEINNQKVDLLAVRGVSHEDCIKHAIDKYTILPHRQVLLVSHDPHNTIYRKRFGSYLKPPNPLLGQERKITDPSSGALQLGFQRLLEVFRQSATVAELQGEVNAELTT